MKGFSIDIEKATLENNNFRKVLYTSKHSQLVLMSLKPVITSYSIHYTKLYEETAINPETDLQVTYAGQVPLFKSLQHLQKQ